jgi:hypothetical protein
VWFLWEASLPALFVDAFIVLWKVPQTVKRDSKYCTAMTVLVGLQTTPLNLSHSFIADYNVGITIALLQTVLSLTVLTIHPFRRLSWPSTIYVGARLFTVDSRLSLSLPTDCLSSYPSTATAVFDCWLSYFDWLQLPSHCLKKGLAGPKWEHLPLLFIYAF